MLDHHQERASRSFYLGRRGRIDDAPLERNGGGMSLMFNRAKTAMIKPIRHRMGVRRSRLTWLTACFVIAAVHAPAGRNARGGEQSTTNIVYVESNDPNGNAILAYERAANGSLTPLPGSPFPTGGLGITTTYALGPFDSDQEVIVNSERTMLFAVNGGSDTIAVFWINNDGSLTPVEGSPFPSGGSNPVSVGLANQTLCVVNQDQDPGHPGDTPPNYTSFHVSPWGQLTPVPFSTIPVDVGSSPSQALTVPHAGLLFGADFLGGLLRSFEIRGEGRLIPRTVQALPPGPFAGTGAPPFPLGLAVHPTQPLLYVGFVTINQVGVYQYNEHGKLNFLRSVPDSGNGVCWLLVNHAGTRLYASNTGDPSVSVFDVSNDPTTPVEIQKVNLNVVPGSSPGGFQFGLDSSGKFLHVVSQQDSATSTSAANALHVFSVGQDGTLTEVPSSPTLLPVPNLVRRQGVAAL
jgi:6-phosphogluconolactonase (cycloisomerase 2 family)